MSKDERFVRFQCSELKCDATTVYPLESLIDPRAKKPARGTFFCWYCDRKGRWTYSPEDGGRMWQSKTNMIEVDYFPKETKNAGKKD